MLLLFFWADVAFAITAAVAVAASFCIFTSIGNVVLLLVCLCCWRASCCCCCWVCVASGAINCLYGSLGFRAIWDHNGHTQHTHTHTTRRHTCNVENKFSLDVLENLLSVDNSAFSGFLRGVKGQNNKWTNQTRTHNYSISLYFSRSVCVVCVLMC